MIDKLEHITVNEKEYPIAFTLNVVENIQDKYGSIDKWSDNIQPTDGRESKIKDIIWTLQEFINEGIDIENDEKEEKRPFLTHKQVGRIISNIGLEEIGNLIRKMTIQSNNTGEEEKNLTAKQNPNPTETE